MYYAKRSVSKKITNPIKSKAIQSKLLSSDTIGLCFALCFMVEIVYCYFC